MTALTPSIRVEQIGNATLYCGDCRDVLPHLGAVDAVVTDPPYGTGGWRRLDAGAGANPSGSLIREEWDDGALEWLDLLPPAPVLSFWPAARTGLLLSAATASGRPKHRALYMRKLDPKPMPAGRISWSVEPVWALSQDGFQLYGGTDWFECSTPRKGRDADATGHPYQKPLACLEWLLSKLRGATAICDPFMGSGTTGVACLKAGLRFVGVERDQSYFEMACQRLWEAGRQPDMLAGARLPDLDPAYQRNLFEGVSDD